MSAGSNLSNYCDNISQIKSSILLKFDPIYNDRMVLQRDLPIPVSGSSLPGQPVSVKLGLSLETTVADSKGRWKVVFEKSPAAGPLFIRAECGNSTIQIDDVWIGEVWLLAGQSNVMWSLQDIGYDSSLPTADRSVEQMDLRLLKIQERSFSEAFKELPQQDWIGIESDKCGGLPAFPVFLAEKLSQGLDCKVGIVVAALAGSSIASWIPRSGFKEDPELEYILSEYPDDPEDYDGLLNAWKKERTAFDENNRERTKRGLPLIPYTQYLFWGPKGTRNLAYPSGAFEAMVRPITNFPLRGVVWYQGESDAYFPEKYGKRLKLMVEKWRDYWRKNTDMDDLPFVTVQLPSFSGDPEAANWPYVREQQALASSKLDRTYCVPTVDFGDPSNIHPSDKEKMAQRVYPFVAALSESKEPELAPVITSWQLIEGNKRGTECLRFFISEDLDYTSGSEVQGIELVDRNGDVMPVPAWFESPRRLVVDLPIGSEWIKGFRYNWKSSPAGRLTGLTGLPLMPFRSRDRSSPPFRDYSRF